MGYVIIKDGKLVEATVGDLHDCAFSVRKHGKGAIAYYWRSEYPSAIRKVWIDHDAGCVMVERVVYESAMQDILEAGTELLVDGNHGQYTYQVLAENYDLCQWGLDRETIEGLLAGPEAIGWHMGAIETALSDAVWTDPNGIKWHLSPSPDGDIFAVSELVPDWVLEDWLW